MGDETAAAEDAADEPPAEIEAADAESADGESADADASADEAEERRGLSGATRDPAEVAGLAPSGDGRR